MDGASKFVRGDAIAGIFITVVNVIGGILIGYFQRDMSMSDSFKHTQYFRLETALLLKFLPLLYQLLLVF